MKITIEDIGVILTFLVSFISAVEFLFKKLKKQVDKTLDPINDSIRQLDVAQCKNFLVNFFGNVEKGVKLDEIELQRAYEVYDHYINDLKQNSYIHKRWDKFFQGDKDE